MHKLKITSKGWGGYTGFLGQIEFKNGVSVNPVPRHQADAIAASMSVVELDDGGDEIAQAGAASRLVGGATIAAEVRKPLERVSEEDLAAERERARERAARAEALKAVTKIYTEEDLLAVADAEGIKGLRAIAKPYGVKGRAIPELVEEILKAQEESKIKEAGMRLVAGAEQVADDAGEEEAEEAEEDETDSAEEDEADPADPADETEEEAAQ